jgi:hypothetical protein
MTSHHNPKEGQMDDKKDELQIFNEGAWDLDFQDVTIEALEQRLELAIAHTHIIPDLSCGGLFICQSAFGCDTFVCGGQFC